MIVSQWHCELPCLHCSQCLPSRSPLSLLPAPCRSVPLGLKTDTKRQPRPNIDWVSGPQPSPSAGTERLKGHHCSARTQRPIAGFLAVQRDGPRGRRRRERWLWRVCISDLRWGGGGGWGSYSWRDSTVSGVRETSALEARGCGGGTVSRPRSPGVGSEPVFPPRGSVNLKRHQRELTECDFLSGGFRSYQ